MTTSDETPVTGEELASGPDESVGTRSGMFSRGSGDTSGFGGFEQTVVVSPAARPPYGGWYDGAIAILGEGLAAQGTELSAALEKVSVDRGELTLFIRREHLVAVCQLLRDDPDLRFELSLGVNGVHYPDDTGRELHACYHLISITHDSRWLRLEVTCPDSDPHIPSTTGVYPANDWHERETFDLFGIVFDGHTSLARIAMPDDWVGHPQRKDYPLGGIPVEYMGASIPPPDARRSYS